MISLLKFGSGTYFITYY